MIINITSSVIHNEQDQPGLRSDPTLADGGRHSTRHTHITQQKQKGNKCWNKILLISPGAANRAASMEGAKSPFLFYCMNANPAGKRR